MKDYIEKLFKKIKKNILEGNYILKIINKKRFKKQFPKETGLFDIMDESKDELMERFVFNEQNIDEYICNLMICKWLWDHDDNRYKDFTFIIRPQNLQIGLKDVTFEDLLDFFSPQTNKYKSK